jgi:hypothetical protein
MRERSRERELGAVQSGACRASIACSRACGLRPGRKHFSALEAKLGPELCRITSVPPPLQDGGRCFLARRTTLLEEPEEGRAQCGVCSRHREYALPRRRGYPHDRGLYWRQPRTRNCPGPGGSTGNSTIWRASDPPFFVNITARYVSVMPVLSSWRRVSMPGIPGWPVARGNVHAALGARLAEPGISFVYPHCMLFPGWIQEYAMVRK